MRKICAIVILVLILGACSETQSVYQKKGICYSRQSNRIFGLQIDTSQFQADKKDCK